VVFYFKSTLHYNKYTTKFMTYEKSVGLI